MCTKYYTDFTYIEIQRNRELCQQVSRKAGQNGTKHCALLKGQGSKSTGRTSSHPAYVWHRVEQNLWMILNVQI